MIDIVIVGLTDEELTTEYFERFKQKPGKMEALADQFSDMDSKDDEDEEAGLHGRKPF